jgi:hypothetical protein
MNISTCSFPNAILWNVFSRHYLLNVIETQFWNWNLENIYIFISDVHRKTSINESATEF